MKIPMKVTSYMVRENLASSLYRKHGQCVMELVKNGLVASMRSNLWEPKLAKIEIELTANHPFIQGPALVVLDRGCGMTDPALQRYFGWLGTPRDKVRENNNGSNNGMSQKGIGRLAALGLNRDCRRDDMESGYFLFSRTSQSGNIRLIHVTPDMFEGDGVEVGNFVSPTSTEARFLNDIQGSFTAIVIPNPVFDQPSDILEEIRWLLPREQNNMFDLSLNGKPVKLPMLQDKVVITSRDGLYRARLGIVSGRAGMDDVENSGIWLCDSTTSLRVADCRKLHEILPPPLWYPDLVGDIFGPGLLRHQDTGRNTIAKEFMRKGNHEWRKLYEFLVNDVVPPATQLTGRDEVVGDLAKIIGGLVELFHEKYGPPEKIVTTVHRDPREPVVCPGPRKPVEKSDKPPAPRYESIKVRNKVYKLYYNMPLGPHHFAKPHHSDSQMICVNVKGGYESLPDNKHEVREHCLMQLLLAIGQAEKRGVTHDTIQFANEVRAEFLRKKGK